MLSKYTFLAPNLIRVIGEGADYAQPPIPQSFGPSKFAPTPLMGLYCSKLESSCRYFSDGADYAHHIAACPPEMINPIQNQGGADYAHHIILPAPPDSKCYLNLS